MKKAWEIDYILIGAVSVLIILGILILASVSAPLSQEKFGKPTYFLFHQIMVGLIPGLIFGFLAFRVPINFFRKWSLVFLIINLFSMVLVFAPKIGVASGGASRWINLGLFSLQPSEFLKITFVLYIAAWLSSRIEIKKNRFSSGKNQKIEAREALFPFMMILGAVTLLLAKQPDISTLGVIIATAALLYFASGTPVYHSVLIILIGAIGLFAFIGTASYRFNRFLTFLRPEIDPMGIGYQIKQALIAVGSGGILGQGLEESFRKFSFLPHPISDSIFAVFAREFGFIGSLFLVSLFLVFAWRGFTISKASQNKFSQLTALGISFWITIQAFINIGSIIGILPLSGVPLPFISYGGSALITELIGVGILLNISKKGL